MLLARTDEVIEYHAHCCTAWVRLGTKLNCRFTPPGSGDWGKADLMQKHCSHDLPNVGAWQRLTAVQFFSLDRDGAACIERDGCLQQPRDLNSGPLSATRCRNAALLQARRARSFTAALPAARALAVRRGCGVPILRRLNLVREAGD
jgi:hypothetical protein